MKFLFFALFFFVILIPLVLGIIIPIYKDHSKVTGGIINYDNIMKKFVKVIAFAMAIVTLMCMLASCGALSGKYEGITVQYEFKGSKVIISSKIDWTPYIEYICKQAMDGKAIDTDWTGTIATNSVVLTDINVPAAAAGTVEAIEAAKAAFVAGEIKVFNTAADNFMLKDGAKIESYNADVDTDEAFTPDTEVVFDGFFHESEFRSAPYFDLIIDGIEAAQ